MPVIFSNYFSSNKDIHHHHTRSSSLLHLSSVSTSVCTKSTKFKPVSYGIPYQKDLEKSRTLIRLELNCPFTWLTILWGKIVSIINRICATVVNIILYLYLWVYFYFLCNVCVWFFFFFFFHKVASLLGLCLFWQPATWFIYFQLYCIVLLFLFWQIKFSLSLSLSLYFYKR